MSDELQTRLTALLNENERQRVEILRLKATIDDVIESMKAMTRMVLMSKTLDWMWPVTGLMGVAVGFLAGKFL